MLWAFISHKSLSLGPDDVRAARIVFALCFTRNKCMIFQVYDFSSS